MTAADLETGMGEVYKATVKSLKPSSGSEMWKILGAIFLLVLCVTAAVFFTWHYTTPGQQEAHMDIPSTSGTADHQRMVTRIRKNKNAAIHLHVSGHDSKVKSFQWVSDVDQSFSKGGLKLLDNTIVIPSDGMYFVYTQAAFAVLCGPNEEDEDSNHMPLSHAVVWSSPASPSNADKPNYLLNGVKSVCQASMQRQNSEELVYDNIYLGAIFQLHKGDKLSTETNHGNEIDDQPSKTFFGVFRL